ncbi:MAG: TonB family protein, partial [Acidobacteria bacterium]|nr:TonB family protein [Acidobacteriota bacterium]
LMHSEHAEAFRQYLVALGKGDAELLSHLKVTESELEEQFRAYLTLFITRMARNQIQVQSGRWTMKVESIPDTDALTSISEIFFAMGNTREARRRLEALFALSHEFPRASYYRGLLARISGESDARDWFIDALTDPHLAARAAVQLVQIGDTEIPAVRSVLEEAAAAGTRYSDVYLALHELYLAEAKRFAETNPLPLGEGARVQRARVREPLEHHRYSEGSEDHIKYRLLSNSDRPKLETFIAPDYPSELRNEKISGEVVIDIQLMEDGTVGGIWLVSATDEIFSGLATTAVRRWRFEAIPAKIRVVLEFTP